IARYERAMSLALETIAAASPLDRPDAIPSMIQPVLPPASVVEKPGARFLWLREFQALFQRELPLLRNPNEANGPTLLQSARAFEQCALAACNADSFAGFRAAANIADSIRESRVARIKDGHDDAELDQFLADWEQSLKGRESILSRNPAPADEIDPFRAGVLLPRAAALQKIRERKEARSRLRNEVDRWISRAGALLEDPATMADPVPLHAAAEQGSLLEDSGVWTEIASGPRSEAFFLHGLLELAAGMLENSPPERLRERASRLIRDARSLNPEIVTPWKEKLSPKIMSWLEGLPR
ncbi:MAG TPA: hypothetical protein VMU54_20565, partial [Planctomycetota bacterium]|nr:hypothetical protein [Planctomycetota bacterium]